MPIFLLAEDAFPIFSDIEKQLEYEERKIEINEVNERDMVLSGGGSEFNYLSLLNPYLDAYSQQPLYLNSNISSQYQYIYSFEIILNGRTIDELEFLRTVGLHDKFDKIVADFNSRVDDYNATIENNHPYYIKYGKYNDSEYILKSESKRTLYSTIRFVNTSSSWYFSYWLIESLVKRYWDNESLRKINKGFAHHYEKIAILSGAVIFLNIYVNKLISDKVDLEVINVISSKPQLVQSLESYQLIKLAESYNKKLYNEIDNH